MTIEEIFKFLNVTLAKELTPVQEQVLRLAWNGHTYGEMATVLHYKDAYLKNIASELWQELTQAFGEPITKANFNLKLHSRKLNLNEQPLTQKVDGDSSTKIVPEYLYGPVPLDSLLYIERPPIEQLAYAEIEKPGGILRIKAPAKMGKSSLLLRIIAQSEVMNYKVVKIDFREAEQAVFANLDQFLRWFCVNISRKLRIKSQMEKYWDQDTESKVNFNFYLQEYLLKQLEHPCIILLNDIDYVFNYPKIAQDFLPLLRFWHEQAKQALSWQKIRLVIVHSSEIYFPLLFHQSPFNVGLSLTLPEFNLEQVQELAERHYLSWTDEQGMKKVRSLMQMVSGHPYLIRLALYYLRWRGLSLKGLLKNAPTPAGIYGEYLRNYSVILQNYPELAVAWSKVIEASGPIQLETLTAYKLESLGLVKLSQGMAIPSCNLYRLYFRQQFSQENPTFILENYLLQLEQDNQRLQHLCQIDELTKLANRQGLDETLLKEWRRLARQKSPLSLIMCDIDGFKQYNNNYGMLAGDICLQQIAEIINKSVQRASDFVARYELDSFAIILPETEAMGAIKVAEMIQAKVRALAIPLDYDQPFPIVTLSLGVACAIPQPQKSVTMMVEEVSKALCAAKKEGCDRVILSSVLNFGL